MKTPRLLPFVLLFLLTACAGGEAAAPPEPHAITPQDTPAPAPTQPPASPLAGLVYSAGSALWQINADGSPASLAACAQGAALSPDGTQMVYAGDDYDIYLLDLATCTRTNITNSPDTVELNPQWWPNVTGAVLIGLNPEFDTGKPALIQLGREGVQLIDPDASPADLPAISPDGQTLAYAHGGQPILYSLSAGRQALDLAAFGLDPASIQRVDSPAWSPDGRSLAWVVATQQGDDFTTWRIQLLILNLEARTSLLLHPYVPLGRGGWPPAPVWSPDGRWLAFNPWVEDIAQTGLVVLAADGSEEHTITVTNPQNTWLDQLTPPRWSPDSTRLAFALSPAEPIFWWLSLANWQPQPLPLPPDAVLIAWR
ncbi:MAG: hypothetical protein EPO32_07645 [Anaerolineae bacterium]|nr:MAG: hypothetical protein EPO32_07645 [Anaerolineae bacterium]